MSKSEYAAVDEMWRRVLEDHEYRTPVPPNRRIVRAFPWLAAARFHIVTSWVIVQLSLDAKKGRCDRARWARTCLGIFRSAEAAGGRYTVTGLGVVDAVEGPAVFVANHMSALETYILGALILPFKDMTFIVKQSLFEYPVFGDIMKAIDAIPVTRDNPREDLKQIMGRGAQDLERGRSIVVFPQHTRMPAFDPRQFNSAGAKLAARNNVPIVPVALKTDFLENGRRLKDFGPVFPRRPINVAFGKKIDATGTGKEAHAATVDFIRGRLIEWGGDIRGEG